MNKKRKKLKIGIILGGNLENLNFLRKDKKKIVSMPYGKAEFYPFVKCYFYFL